MQLAAPANYFPFKSGHYKVAAGLFPLDTDFGNGPRDAHIFQLDNLYADYRRQKNQAHDATPEKHYCRATPDPHTSAQAARLIIAQLCRQHPDKFSCQKQNSQWLLHCRPSGETLCFGPQYQLQTARETPSYADALDALAHQIQEDFAIVEFSPRGEDRISLLHLSFPNHWSAQEKIGNTFQQAHRGVPGMARINAHGGRLLETAMEKGPYVRFAWGLASDDRLNHHPDTPPGQEQKSWHGRCFSPQDPRLMLRVERQVLQGIPQSPGLLFTIRTYLYDVARIKADSGMSSALRGALLSMSADTLRYKGLDESLAAILNWLDVSD